MKKNVITNAIKTVLQTSSAIGASVVTGYLAKAALDHEDLVHSVILGNAAVITGTTTLNLTIMAIKSAQTLIEEVTSKKEVETV